MIPPSPADRVLVLGHKGMLGRAVMARLGPRAVGADLPECDITRPDHLHAALAAAAPAAVLNCAAWTDVDGAEAHETEARRVNALAVGELARLCRDAGLYLLTISTDYVFNGQGERPWPEDAPDEVFGPTTAYGRTKLEGERLVRAAGGRWCIVRTQWLYGEGGRNFVDTIAALAAQKPVLKVVDDQVGAPTWTVDLADALALLLDRRAEGVYHCVNSGFASWCAVARHVVERLGLPARIEPCTSAEYPRPARRPLNSRMDQAKFAALAGAPMRPWTEALDEYLRPRRAAP